MLRHRVTTSCLVLLAALLAACSLDAQPSTSSTPTASGSGATPTVMSPGSGSTPAAPSPTDTVAPQGGSSLGWPFDVHAGLWVISTGYNTGPDHSGYERYSFDFQQRESTTVGLAILSPVAGDVSDAGSAYPYDSSSGRCARISFDGHSGYFVPLCNLVTVTPGHVRRGDRISTVADGANGNQIHITLYSLAPGAADQAANRKPIPFASPWTLAGCSYPANGKADQWGRTMVPC